MTAEVALRKLKTKLLSQLYLRAVLNDLTLLFFIGAGGIFLCRLYSLSLTKLGIAMGLACLGILIRAWILAQQQLPQPQTLRAILDRHNDAGGLFMAAEEIALDAWPVPNQQLPKVSGLKPNHLIKPGSALLFMLLFILLPTHWLHQLDPNDKAQALDVTGIETTIEKMEEAELIEEQTAKEMVDVLKTISEKASLDATTWEALDTLEEQLNDVQAQKDQSLADAQETLAALKQALEQVAKTEDEDLREQAMDDLLNMAKEMGPEALQQAMADNNGRDDQNGNQNATDLASALEKTQMSLAEKQALLAELSSKKGSFKKSSDPGSSKKRAKSQKLAEMLEDFEAKSGGQCEALSQCLFAGGLGTDDNGQSGELTWKDPDQHQAGEWEPLGLNHALDGDESVTLNTFEVNPEEDTESSARYNQRLQQGQGGGAHRHAVLPHHRKVVKRFFDDQQRDGEQPKP